jgi:aspartate/methionine/tyrosine aminotransferase
MRQGELAPYMTWAKLRPPPRHDLAGSNLLACSLADLPGASSPEPNGPNSEGWPPLVDLIASRYGVEPDQVATGAGCSGANFLAFAALVQPGDEVIVERPGYDPLLGALELLGARIVRFDRGFADRWAVDPERVRSAMTPRTRLVVITSPHNPTGVLTPLEVLDRLAADAAAVGAHVLVDEVYLDSAFNERPSPAATRHEALISTNSLTKCYGLSGLRIGWALASRKVARAARRARDVVDVCGALPAERMAVSAFQRLDALEARARSIIRPNAERVSRFLSARPEMEWVPPEGGTMVFPRIRGVRDTRQLAADLMDRHQVAVVPGAFFDAPEHIRIAFGADADTVSAGLTALGDILDGLP